jgi:hypothetical protein
MAEVLEDVPYFRPPVYQQRVVRSFYQALPGDPPSTYAGIFGCPQGDVTWYRPTVGSPIPECRTHHVLLVRLS